MESRDSTNYKILVFAPNEAEADNFLAFLTGIRGIKFTRSASTQTSFHLVRDSDNNINYPCYHIATVRAKNENAVKKILQRNEAVINGATSYVLVRPNQVNLDGVPPKKNKWKKETLEAVKTYFSNLGIPAIPVYDNASEYGSTKLPTIKKMLRTHNEPYDAERTKIATDWVVIEEEKEFFYSFASYTPQASLSRRKPSAAKKEKDQELKTFSSYEPWSEEKEEEKLENNVQEREEEKERKLSILSKPEKKANRPGFFSTQFNKIKTFSQSFSTKPKNETDKKKDLEQAACIILETFFEKDSDSESETRLTRKKSGGK